MTGALGKLAIKEQLGVGTVPLLADLSAIGTTLVMLRFLIETSRIAPSPDRLPDRGLAAPWIGMTLAALTVPWVLFSDLAGRSLLYALAPGNVWDALWPIALGMVIMFAAVRFSQRAAPEVPEGDLVVIGEVVAAASVRAFSRLHWPPLEPIQAPFLLAAAWFARRFDDIDGTLNGWPVAGSLLIAIAALIAVAIVS